MNAWVEAFARITAGKDPRPEFQIEFRNSGFFRNSTFSFTETVKFFAKFRIQTGTHDKFRFASLSQTPFCIDFFPISEGDSGFKCECCDNGMEFDNFYNRCVDIDECATYTHNCSPNQACVDEFKSYSCILVTPWDSGCCQVIELDESFETIGKAELVGEYFIQTYALHNQRSFYKMKSENGDFFFSYYEEGGWQITKGENPGDSGNLNFITGYLWDTSITCVDPGLTDEYTFYFHDATQNSWHSIPEGSISCKLQLESTTSRPPTTIIPTMTTWPCWNNGWNKVTCWPPSCDDDEIIITVEPDSDCECPTYLCGESNTDCGLQYIILEMSLNA